MQSFFSSAGEAALAAIDARRTLYAFDFDGTLAPIVAVPAQAQASQDMLKRLQALAASAQVAVVSGRSRADLLERLPREVQHLIGNHGNEGLDEKLDSQKLRTICGVWLPQLKSALLAIADAGVFVEDKGVSLSLHYRLARDQSSAERALLEIASKLQPAPNLIPGKLAMNLLPRGAYNKFDAVTMLAERTRCTDVVFVGDDDTDEIVFDRAPPHWLTVRVDHSPASSARFFVDRQEDVLLLIESVLQGLSAAPH